MNSQAFCFMATAITACALAEFTVTPGITQAVNSSKAHVSFVKRWTLTTASTANAIDSISLNLAGCVYVSYVSGLPSGVLGYVNVSGDSQTVVDTVIASNDDANDTDDSDDVNDNNGELNVRIGNKTSTPVSGYLLTEIMLASSGVVTDLKSQHSAQVVIEDGVLVTSSITAELQLEASGSSAVYVSAASTAVNVRQLQLDAADTASLQFNVMNVSVTDEATFESQGSAEISLLASSLEVATLELDAQNTSTICMSAQQVTVTSYEGQAASRISMPNAANKYDSTGSFACDEAIVPAREAACVSSACGGTTGSGATTSATMTLGTTVANDDDDNSSASDDDTSAALAPQLAAFAAAAIGVAMASLL